MPGKVDEVGKLPFPRPKGVEAKFEKFIERIVAKHTVNIARLVGLPRYFFMVVLCPVEIFLKKMQLQIMVQMPVVRVLTIKLSSAGSPVCGGLPSSLSREGPQLSSSLIDYSSDCLFSISCLLSKMNSQILP